MTVANGKEISCAQTFAIKSQRTVKINTDAALDALSQAEPQQSGGSFTYPDEQDDAALRNRFLLWRTNGATLNIEEHSLERELKENSITVQFSGSRIIPGCGCFTSRGLLVFIVPTVCSVHRFIMNHPFTLEKRAPGMSVLSSFPEGDKLAMFHDQAALTASSAPVRAAVALGADGRSVVALCLADGSVQLVTLSAYGDKNAPGATQTTLRHDGAMKRLLRLSNETDAAVDLVLQREHKLDDTFVYVVHRDGKLRIWSSTVSIRDDIIVS
uniref:Nucleoporin Nup133/Nup155-like N-terminal domain-containing protein n=1 Tax=Plectus sambesii TaxID=2011161 RepID=A0A914XHI8_9BILA